MGISDKIIGNILGKPKSRGGKNDWDGDGVPNKKDCQPRNTMRQDKTIRPPYNIDMVKLNELQKKYPHMTRDEILDRMIYLER